MAAVRNAVRYDIPRDFGLGKPETRREFNRRFNQPEGPETKVPQHGRYLWEWFWALCGRRQKRSPLTYQEIDAWARLMEEQPRPHEIEAILSMDSAFLQEMAQADREQEARQKSAAPAPKRGK